MADDEEFFFDQSNENFRPPHIMTSFIEMANINNKNNNNNSSSVNVLSDTNLMNSVFDDHVLPSDGMAKSGVSAPAASSATAEGRLQSSGLFFNDKTDQLSQILSGMNIKKNAINVPVASAAASSKRLDQAVAMTATRVGVEEEQDDFNFNFSDYAGFYDDDENNDDDDDDENDENDDDDDDYDNLTSLKTILLFIALHIFNRGANAGQIKIKDG